MTLRSDLAVCLFVIIAITRACFGKTQAQSGQFSRLGVNGERLSQPYKTVETSSRIQCAYFCQKEGFVAFSHHAAESNCELTDEAGLAFGYQQTDDGGWVIYMSREPTECGIPEHKNKTILRGNLYNVGSKICYECSEGFVNIESSKKQCSTCMGDGNWTTVNITCTCQGWLEYNEHCYLIVNDMKNWDDAEDNCNEKSAYLVNFNDEEEEAFVAKFVTMFWIGANDKLLHGNFTWQDGSPLVYSNWDTDQPSHGDEHCVLKEEGTLTWHDYPCDTEVKSVCEKP